MEDIKKRLAEIVSEVVNNRAGEKVDDYRNWIIACHLYRQLMQEFVQREVK